MTRLPESITRMNELKAVARVMKENGLQVPIKGYRFYNGKQHSYTIGMARANDAGDDILIESRNIREPVAVCTSSIYPQILQALRGCIKSA